MCKGEGHILYEGGVCERSACGSVCVDLLNFTIIFHGYIYLYMLVVLVMDASDPPPTCSFPHAARAGDKWDNTGVC